MVVKALKILEMSRFIVISILVVFCSSCMAQKTVKFSTGESKYLLNVPSGYELREVTDYHGLKEYRLVYPDSSIIYITDDDKSGGAVNTIKAEKYGDGIYLKILSADTLDIDGMKNERYWREQKKGKVVIGYINVPPDKKERYDQALATIRKKK